MPGSIRLINPQGETVDVPTEAAGSVLDQPGWRVPTYDDTVERVGAQAREETYGGIGGGLQATGAAVARGATLGASDVFARALGDEDTAGNLRGLRDENPGLSLAGELVGAAAPALLSGGGTAGASLPAALATRAGAGLTERLGAGLLAKAGGAALEGTLYGVGSGVSELALSEDPLTWERAASTIGSHALFGGGTGAVAGLALGAVEKGLSAGKRAIDARLTRAALEDEAAALAPELSTLDRRGLTAARKAEEETLAAARRPDKAALVDDVETHFEEMRDGALFRAAYGTDERSIRSAGKSMRNANIKLRNKLDIKANLVENPEVILDHLAQEEQALQKVAKFGENELEHWKRAVDDTPVRVRAQIKAGLIEGERGPFSSVVDSETGKSGLDVAVDRELKRRATIPWKYNEWFDKGITGTAMPENLRLIDERFGEALASNRALQERVRKLAEPVASKHLADIDKALEALGEVKQETLGQRLLNHVPGGKVVSELAGLGSRATGAMRTAINKAARKTGEVASAFAGKAAPVVAKSTPIATKVLASLRYGESDDDQADHTSPAPQDLAGLYKARTDEVKAQTAYDEAGVPRVRPHVREAIADRLHAARVANPIFGDRLETLAVRRLEYLSSLIPRMPDLGGLETGKSSWRPSDMEMRSWARSAAAVEDPAGVEERVASGTVTPEDAAAYWAVYPERARDFQQQILSSLSEVRAKLPYEKRLSLGIFTGVPVDPSMNPRILGVLQSQFPAEPGTQGGTAAPQAEPAPAYGKIGKSLDAPTAAQHRSQGARL